MDIFEKIQQQSIKRFINYLDKLAINQNDKADLLKKFKTKNTIERIKQTVLR